ncbi:integrase catalytic domain-containing protein [Trichonephila clavipes]|nr:integrase catalytic domain-containing protein [Trichonephila clavipes]
MNAVERINDGGSTSAARAVEIMQVDNEIAFILTSDCCENLLCEKLFLWETAQSLDSLSKSGQGVCRPHTKQFKGRSQPASQMCWRREVSRVLNEKKSYLANYFWTDSTTSASWIRGSQQQMEGFVANRVKEIRSLTDKGSWRHCPGKDNPSDLLTRGISADSH